MDVDCLKMLSLELENLGQFSNKMEKAIYIKFYLGISCFSRSL